MGIQLNQVLIDGALSRLRTVDREALKNAFVILDNLLGDSFPISVSGSIITIGASEYQTVESDGSDSVQNREKLGAPPISNKYASIAASTLDVSDGSATGDMASGQDGLAAMLQDYYVAIGFELRGNGKWSIKAGTPVAAKVDALSSSNVPSFSSSAVVKKAIWILQKDTGGGDWNFKNPNLQDLIILPVGAGGGGSGTDFVPAYKDASQYTVQPTGGSKVKLNNKYFYLTESFDVNFDTSVEGTWYICIDTSLAEGEIDSSYLVETQDVPGTATFNPKYAVIGEYEVASSVVVQSSFNGYSTREMTSWLDALPNLRETSGGQKTADGSYDFNHYFVGFPTKVTCYYWDESEGELIEIANQEVNVRITSAKVFYDIPSGHPVMTFDSGDYFECMAIYLDAEGSGFASPKSDDSTDWYSSTPPTTISHGLFSRPLAITLEWWNTVNNRYKIESGDQYIDFNSDDCLTSSQVIFEWTGLPAVSSNLKLKIHFHKSRISAGAFEASKTELGMTKVTGDSTLVETPDLVLDSSHTSYATQVNALADNSFVYLKESVTITAMQDITKKIKWMSAYGAKVISATALTSMVKFSAKPHIVSICLEAQNDITNALEFSANFRCDSASFIMNGSGKTLTNTVQINTGYKGFVNGLSEATLGTITNVTGNDDDNLSSRNII